MLSGNKYMSRSSLGNTIYQNLQKKTTWKRGTTWRFVKICLIKRSTEVIGTQWQNFLQDPRINLICMNRWRFCLCLFWGFMAQSTQWDYVECGQFTCHTFFGQAKSSKQLTSNVHILSPETDNCPSCISRRERMTIENISWSNLHKRMLRTQQGLNPQPPDHQSDAHPSHRGQQIDDKNKFMEIHWKEKFDLILFLSFQMRKKFTNVWFTAIRKTNYKYMYNDRYSHFVPIPILWTNLVDLVSPMLYTKSQPQSCLGSGEENIKSFYHIWAWLPSCSMVWNNMNSVDTLLTEGPMWNLVWNLLKRFQRRRNFKFHNFIHAYSLRTEQITLRGQTWL